MVDLQAPDQRRCRRQIKYGFGDERARQRLTIFWRSSRHAIAQAHECLHARHAKHGNEPLVFLCQRTNLDPQQREKLALNVMEGV